MANVIFKRGAKENLDAVAIADGQILFTNDEGHIYFDVAGKRVELYAEDIKKLNDAINKLTAASGDGSVSDIVAKELAKALIPENANESLDTLQEIAQWIQDHPGDVAEMNKAIAANKDAIDKLMAGMTEEPDPENPDAPVEIKSVKEVVTEAIEGLDATDAAVDGEYVASVSQTDGKITVTRKSLPTNDIPWGDFANVADNE